MLLPGEHLTACCRHVPACILAHQPGYIIKRCILVLLPEGLGGATGDEARLCNKVLLVLYLSGMRVGLTF